MNSLLLSQTKYETYDSIGTKETNPRNSAATLEVVTECRAAGITCDKRSTSAKIKYKIPSAASNRCALLDLHVIEIKKMQKKTSITGGMARMYI